MIRKVDKLRISEKEKIVARVDDLHKNIEDMEHLINQLQTECPIKFRPQKQEIEEKLAGVNKQYEDAMSAVWQF
jgi:hypothetical protein